jgi:hypothetical protein
VGAKEPVDVRLKVGVGAPVTVGVTVGVDVGPTEAVVLCVLVIVGTSV